MTAPEADLTGWTAAPFSAAGYTHDVYRKGEGPGVVLIPEMPGIHPGVLALGNHLVDNGFTVAAPSLFGKPERPAIGPATLPVLMRGCVAKEFAAFATNADRPVAHYLRVLARDLNEQTPGKGVGVIGQCFTGGFALAAAVDDSVLAPVLSQPSAAVAADAGAAVRSGAFRRRTEDHRTACRRRGLVRDGPAVQRRQDVSQRALQDAEGSVGDAFEVIEINSTKGNAHGIGRMAHSVLTDQVREIDGHPAYEARKRVVEFLTERLT